MSSKKVFQAGLEGQSYHLRRYDWSPRVWFGPMSRAVFTVKRAPGGRCGTSNLRAGDQSVQSRPRRKATHSSVKSGIRPFTMPQNVLVHQQSTPDHPWDWNSDMMLHDVARCYILLYPVYIYICTYQHLQRGHKWKPQPTTFLHESSRHSCRKCKGQLVQYLEESP